jgi:cystathionine gamma-synthase
MLVSAGGSVLPGRQMMLPEDAQVFPQKLEIFTNATSLGAVESLIEQRARSSPGEDPRIVRISVGIEELEDLKDDMRRVFQEIAQASPAYSPFLRSRLTGLY